MTEPPQVASGSYVRMLRSYRVLILLLASLSAGAAAGLSLSQQKLYVSQAQLSFQEENRSNALAGIAVGQVQTAEQLAAQGADTILSDEVLEGARTRLRTSRTTAQLRTMLSTTVETSSGLVTVSAESSDKRFAAKLTNEVARAAVDVQTRSERDRFKLAADRVQAQLRKLQRRDKRNRDSAALSVSFFDRIASLRTLSVNATPVRVAKPATVAGSPTSPKPLRDTLFGLLIGLLLGVLIAFVRTSTDQRLADSEEIRDELDLPVVGSIRRDALGHAAYIANGLGPMTDQDLESFRILRTNLEFLADDSPPKSIVVTSAMPEEGKSTVAASLALVTAAMGKAALLVECDLRRPCLAERLGLEQGPGLGDLLAGAASIDEVLQTVALSSDALIAAANGDQAEDDAHGAKLEVVTAGTHANRPAELLSTPQLRQFVEDMVGRYEVVIVDTPPLLPVADTLEIIPLVEGLLLCVRADKTTRDQARAAKRVLERLPARPTSLVITGLKPGRESDYGYYSYAHDDG